MQHREEAMNHATSKRTKPEHRVFNAIADSPARKLTLIATMLVGTVLLAAAVRASNQRVPTVALVEPKPTPAALRPLTSAVGQSKAPPKRIETELITCYKDGFEPREIRRAKGPVFLLVKNQTQAEQLTLSLTRQNGAAIHELKMRPGKRRRSGISHLPPCQYRLDE